MVYLKKESDSYGEIVKRFRVQVMHMTQEEFSDLMGVSVGTLRNWEQGSTTVPKYFIRALQVMALDPKKAMAELGVFTAIPGNTGWRNAVGEAHPFDEYSIQDAIDQISGDPDISRTMDTLDSVRNMAGLIGNLGESYRNIDGTDLLLLLQLQELHDVRSLLEKLTEKEPVL